MNYYHVEFFNRAALFFFDNANFSLRKISCGLCVYIKVNCTMKEKHCPSGSLNLYLITMI